MLREDYNPIYSLRYKLLLVQEQTTVKYFVTKVETCDCLDCKICRAGFAFFYIPFTPPRTCCGLLYFVVQQAN